MDEMELDQYGHRSTERDARYGNVANKFLADYLRQSDAHGELDPEEVVINPRDIDISAPTVRDMTAIRAGASEVRLFQTSPRSDAGEGRDYAFYIGAPGGESRTEVHVNGAAADMLTQRIQAAENPPEVPQS